MASKANIMSVPSVGQKKKKASKQGTGSTSPLVTDSQFASS